MGPQLKKKYELEDRVEEITQNATQRDTEIETINKLRDMEDKVAYSNTYNQNFRKGRKNKWYRGNI